MSLIIKPSLCAEKSLFITTTTAVAVARAIETVSDKKTGIKWVNDLFIDGKKVCGILVEGAANQKTGLLDYAVIGIGVNVYEPESGFDAEIKDIAGAVFGLNARKRAYGFSAEIFKLVRCKKTAQELFVNGKRHCIPPSV